MTTATAGYCPECYAPVEEEEMVLFTGFPVEIRVCTPCANYLAGMRSVKRTQVDLTPEEADAFARVARDRR